MANDFITSTENVYEHPETFYNDVLRNLDKERTADAASDNYMKEQIGTEIKAADSTTTPSTTTGE